MLHKSKIVRRDEITNTNAAGPLSSFVIVVGRRVVGDERSMMMFRVPADESCEIADALTQKRVFILL
jgi:hypothetical protein